MLVVVLGALPIVALGLWAWWARARSSKLEIVDLITEAPASKRSKRTATIDAVVLHQMSLGQWAITQLGMSDGGAGYFIDTGAPIPDSWRTYGANT